LSVFICYKNGHTIDAVNAFSSTGMALSLCKDSAKNQKEERKFGFFNNLVYFCKQNSILYQII